MDEDSNAQAAWAQWMKHEYLDRNSIQAAHRAFLAGWAAHRDESLIEQQEDV
jgi:hypothetical protein